MLISIPFTNIKMSVFLPIVIGFLFYADFSLYTLDAIFCAFVHEIGHLAVLALKKEKINAVEVYPVGVKIKFENGVRPYKNEFVEAISGPLANIILSGICFLIWTFFPYNILKFSFLCSALLAFVNLMPIKTLDGGRALEAFLNIYFDEKKTGEITESASYAGFVILTVASLLLFVFAKGNFSLIMFCACVFLSVYVKREY